MRNQLYVQCVIPGINTACSLSPGPSKMELDVEEKTVIYHIPHESHQAGAVN